MHELASRVLAKELRAVARAMRLVDDRIGGHTELLKDLFPHTGRAWIIGVTGNPGAGKSTLSDRLIEALRAQKKTVGVIAVDPTSPFSGGAILGDRIRMQRHALDPGVFIRSVATRGHMGGLSRSARDMVRILDASGYDVILVETVGVGQDELEITRTAHTTLVVMAPGMGDEVQAIKAGLMECADVFAVNKADRDGADSTMRDIELMIALGNDTMVALSKVRGHATHTAADGHVASTGGEQGERWTPPIVKCVATRGEGTAALVVALEKHKVWCDGTERGRARRLARLAQEVREGLREALIEAATRALGLTGSILTAVMALIILVYLNWHLTAVTIVILTTFGVGMATAFKRLRPLFKERGQINAEVTGRLGESLGGVRIVKAYTAEKREELVFAKGAHRLLRNVAQSLTGVSAIGAFSGLVIGAIGIAMMLVGGSAIRAGTMTIGDFVWYLSMIAVITMPVIQLANIGTQMTEAFAGLDRIREIRKMATEDQEDAHRLPMTDTRGEVEFDDVTFEYNPGVPVLKHVSFRAPAGSTTALVGSSGSGKSTLISLVLAFNRPLSGTLLIDGADLGNTKLRDYRAHLGVVLQDNFLFDGTIGENIAYARPHASREEIKAVSRIAHCDEFVEAFEKGYDTIVGERGVRLSGGQRQRVAIARAILADPKILILDEATSSLDSESEALIQDGLKALRRGRTTFVIAHRLSTIQSADQILVLEAGEIVERGTHDELIAKAGRYRQLYDKQYKFERDQFINPGEDFTPEPAAVSGPARTSSAL